jgi:hypothetical protein
LPSTLLATVIASSAPSVLGGASGGLVAAGGIGLGVSGPEIVSLPYRARIDPLPTDLRTGPEKLETHIHVDLDGREVAHAVKTHASRPSRSASPGVPRRFCAGKNGSPSWWRWSVFQDPSTAWVRAVTPVAARADTPLYGATAQANEGPDLKWLDAAVASGPRTRCHGVDRNAPGRHLHDGLARCGPQPREQPPRAAPLLVIRGESRQKPQRTRAFVSRRKLAVSR